MMFAHVAPLPLMQSPRRASLYASAVAFFGNRT